MMRISSASAAVVLVVLTRQSAYFGGWQGVSIRDHPTAPVAENVAIALALSRLQKAFLVIVALRLGSSMDSVLAGSFAGLVESAMGHLCMDSYTSAPRSPSQRGRRRSSVGFVAQTTGCLCIPGRRSGTMSHWTPSSSLTGCGSLKWRFSAVTLFHLLLVLLYRSMWLRLLPSLHPLHHDIAQAQRAMRAQEATPTTSMLIRFITANVLTLYGAAADHGAFASAREEALGQLFSEAGVQVIGVQESRARVQSYSACNDFHILDIAASRRGHGGLLVVRRQILATSGRWEGRAPELLRLVRVP